MKQHNTNQTKMSANSQIYTSMDNSNTVAHSNTEKIANTGKNNKDQPVDLELKYIHFNNVRHIINDLETFISKAILKIYYARKMFNLEINVKDEWSEQHRRTKPLSNIFNQIQVEVNMTKI